MLNIPDNERIAVIIACGYYADKFLVARSPRKDLREIYREV